MSKYIIYSVLKNFKIIIKIKNEILIHLIKVKNGSIQRNLNHHLTFR